MAQQCFYKIGDVYEQWTIIGEPRRKPTDRRVWRGLCRCSCGTERDLQLASLRYKQSTNCGCTGGKTGGKKRQIHGQSLRSYSTAAYRSWKNMRARCLNPNHKHYAYYGGKGVKICRRWNIFANFFADMGNPPKGYTLDRKRSEGNYTKRNCRWASRAEQVRNTSRTVLIRYKERILCLRDWSVVLGISYSKLQYWTSRGKPLGKIIIHHECQ